MRLHRQERLIADHLFRNAHITHWQAEGVYRIRRLAAVIHRLSQAGYEIDSVMAADATGQTYARYSFSAKQRRSIEPINDPWVSTARLRFSQNTVREIDVMTLIEHLLVHRGTYSFAQAATFLSMLSKEDAEVMS